VVIGRKTFDRIYPEHGWTYPANLRGIVMTARPLPQGVPNHVRTSRDPQAVFDRYPNAFVDGGAATISQFLDLGLIREATIFTLPVRLGSGVRLFPMTQRSLDRWSLQYVKQFPCGTVGMTYAIGGLN
jgi:dihydrofolate reductase